MPDGWHVLSKTENIFSYGGSPFLTPKLKILEKKNHPSIEIRTHRNLKSCLTWDWDWGSELRLRGWEVDQRMRGERERERERVSWCAKRGAANQIVEYSAQSAKTDVKWTEHWEGMLTWRCLWNHEIHFNRQNTIEYELHCTCASHLYLQLAHLG